MKHTQKPNLIEELRAVVDCSYSHAERVAIQARLVHRIIRELTRLCEIEAAAKECLPDLARHVSTHGPGPDNRLAVLRSALEERA